MYLLGDSISLVLSLGALIYLVTTLIKEKKGIFFQMIACAIGCHALCYLYDVCEILTTGTLSEGFSISYLGAIGCYLFLLSASYDCMDGIIDDGSPAMAKSRKLARIAPTVAVALFVLNFFADVPFETKHCYFFVRITATACSYYNLKHAIVPDMGFGFIKAIRPFNVAALAFNTLNLLHFTAWNFADWPVITLTGTLVGVSSVIMAVTAKRGVKRWTI